MSQQFRLEHVMVKDSTYPRGHLKRRLLQMGLKVPICEMCGQGELWNGHRMSLILDHINGISNDHRNAVRKWLRWYEAQHDTVDRVGRMIPANSRVIPATWRPDRLR